RTARTTDALRLERICTQPAGFAARLFRAIAARYGTHVAEHAGGRSAGRRIVGWPGRLRPSIPGRRMLSDAHPRAISLRREFAPGRKYNGTARVQLRASVIARPLGPRHVASPTPPASYRAATVMERAAASCKISLPARHSPLLYSRGSVAEVML